MQQAHLGTVSHSDARRTAAISRWRRSSFPPAAMPSPCARRAGASTPRNHRGRWRAADRSCMTYSASTRSMRRSLPILRRLSALPAGNHPKNLIGLRLSAAVTTLDPPGKPRSMIDHSRSWREAPLQAADNPASGSQIPHQRRRNCYLSSAWISSWSMATHAPIPPDTLKARALQLASNCMGVQSLLPGRCESRRVDQGRLSMPAPTA